jgi:anti-sigma regulatory factor (Ser/Thr protein kinase)
VCPVEKVYVLIENPCSENQSISFFNDFRSVIAEVRHRLKTYMTRHQFPEDKVASIAIAAKEGLTNLIHHCPEYEPPFALIELKISDESVELAIEDRERGKIRRFRRDILSERGRGYRIMESLVNVKIQTNQDGFHRVILKLSR